MLLLGSNHFLIKQLFSSVMYVVGPLFHPLKVAYINLFKW